MELSSSSSSNTTKDGLVVPKNDSTMTPTPSSNDDESTSTTPNTPMYEDCKQNFCSCNSDCCCDGEEEEEEDVEDVDELLLTAANCDPDDNNDKMTKKVKKKIPKSTNDQQNTCTTSRNIFSNINCDHKQKNNNHSMHSKNRAPVVQLEEEVDLLEEDEFSKSNKSTNDPQYKNKTIRKPIIDVTLPLVNTEDDDDEQEESYDLYEETSGCIGEDGYLYEKSLKQYADNGNGGGQSLHTNQMGGTSGGLGVGTISPIISVDKPLSYHRVNSSEILYEKKHRKVKFVQKYLLGDVVGEGSYSKVKEVLDTETLERRAAKIMKKKRLRKIPNGEQNVQREIQLLRKLNHENLIKLYDVIIDDIKEKLYIIMEYCVAVLQELLDSVPDTKRLPIHQAHGYFVQLMNGLEYLHSQGIIHKDIKPGNLLLTNGGVVKITDLGVSELLDRFQETDIITRVQGSPAFTPPEIADGRPQFSGFKVDIWASGVTLFNITTGKYPFQGDNIFRLYDNISKGDLNIPPELDDLLSDLIRGMLCKDPDQRFTMPMIKNHDWVRKKHPRIEPMVKIPKKSDEYRSMSVIPYLWELHNGSSSSHMIGSTPNSGDYDFDEDVVYDYSTPQQHPTPQAHFHQPCASHNAPQLIGYSTSSGNSISKLNEYTINSITSNVSKQSKTSNISANLASFFKLHKTKSTKENVGGKTEPELETNNRLPISTTHKKNRFLNCLGIKSTSFGGKRKT